METIECLECCWQGKWNQTDAGLCPECGGECQAVADIYANDRCICKPPQYIYGGTRCAKCYKEIVS